MVESSNISSKLTMEISEVVEVETAECERIDISGTEAPMEGVEAMEDVGDDTMWLSDLQTNPEEALPLERLSFGFGNFDLGLDTVDAVVTDPVPEMLDAATTMGDDVAVLDAAEGMQKVDTDVEREVRPIAGLRAAPHPELLSAGKGKEKSPSAHNDKWSLRRVDQLRASLGWNMKTQFVEEKVVGNRGDYNPLVAPGMSYNSEASSDLVQASSSNVSQASSSNVLLPSSASALLLTNSRTSASLIDRVTGKAVAVSMCNEVKESERRMVVLQPAQQFPVGGTEQQLTRNNPAQQLTAWHQDYDNIDWEEECRKNPTLQKVLGVASGSGGGSQVSIGSRIGSSLAGNSFHLGANYVINFICDRKDDDKENKPVN